MDGLTLMVFGWRILGNVSVGRTASGRSGVNGYSSGLRWVGCRSLVHGGSGAWTCLVYRLAFASIPGVSE